jgi:hypothetical protein
MKATGRYDTRLDAQLSDLYSGRFGTPVTRGAEDRDASPAATLAAASAAADAAEARGEALPREDMQLGNSWAVLPDDLALDKAMPLRESWRGVQLRQAHKLPNVPPPPRTARPVHDSKMVFRDISGRGGQHGRLINPLLVSDYDGACRPATNRETLYRSWVSRYWSVAKAHPQSSRMWPFADKDADKPWEKGGFVLSI